MPSDNGRDDTSIRISVDTWRRLKDLKSRPNESFDDVIQELLESEGGEGNPTTPMADEITA